MSGVALLRMDRVAGAGGHPRHGHPPLDLKIVEAGLARAEILTTLVDGWRIPGGPDAWATRALAAAPRVAVIKAETWCLPEALACAARLRGAGVLTVAIGQQVAHAQRVAVSGWDTAYDVALAGEAEEDVLQLLPRLLDGEHGLPENYRQRFRNGERFSVRNAEVLPWPEFSDEEMQAFAFPFPLPGPALKRWAYVLTARGCPHRCRHCSTIVRKSAGGDLRTRAPVAVVDEIAAHLARGAEAIAFEDDTLLVDRRHFLAICEEMARRSIRMPWIANARPDELDEERVAAAAAAGAILFKLGIESATPRLLEAMGKARRGSVWIQQTEEGMVRLRQHGIGAVGLFLIGLPTQTEDEVAATLAWARRLAPDYVQVQLFRSYPDIDWWPDLPPASRDAEGAYHYGPVRVTTASIPAPALASLQQGFYRRFYLRPGFVARHLLRCWRHYADPAVMGAGATRLAYVLRGAGNGQRLAAEAGGRGA